MGIKYRGLMEYLSYFFEAFITIFVIVDPPGNIPLFISLTERATKQERNIISKKSTLIGLVLLIFITLTGGYILTFFNVTLDGLKIAGGILLFVISIDILMGGRRKARYIESEGHIDTDSLATFPIALPLYTGPGAISVGIVLFTTASEPLNKLLVILGIIITFAIVRITHMFSDGIVNILGKSGSNVISRLMAIFLAAIAIEYFFSGLAGKLAILPF